MLPFPHSDGDVQYDAGLSLTPH